MGENGLFFIDRKFKCIYFVSILNKDSFAVPE